MTVLLCTGDDQLGKLARLPGDGLAEQEQNWHRRIELARELRAEALLYLGDAVERRSPSPAELAAFERPLIYAREQGLHVIAIVGNHDVQHPDQETALDLLAAAGLLTLHRTPGLEIIGDTVVALLPWTPLSVLRAAEGGGDTDDLHALAERLLLRAGVCSAARRRSSPSTTRSAAPCPRPERRSEASSASRCCRST